VNIHSKFWRAGLAFGALALLAMTPAAAAEISGKGWLAAAKGGVAEVKTVDGIDFGDNSSEWANDGECDDPRFVGPGTAVELLDEDIGRDANDCLTLYQAGEVSLAPVPADIVDEIDFGDNSSEWANDGECDDPRFVGKGVDDILLDEDMARDANDCRSLFLSGEIDYLGDDPNMELITFDGIVFGDNTSEWANDEECDDPRFTGTGMADVLLDADLEKDANDCLALYQSGSISLAGANQNSGSGIDFGDDSSEWSNDGECDDPRFKGPGVADILLDEDLGRDATDCRTLFENGQISLETINGGGADSSGIDFGDDSSQWSNDGECDDPRFGGPGVAGVLLDEDMGRDATDCRTLFESGQVYLETGGSGGFSGIDFGDDSSRWNNDGECDDPRFVGDGVGVKLLLEDLGRDATDCRTLFDTGEISPISASNFDFGDDSSRWNNDGECDDPRFEGEGMAAKLEPRDFASDATDCQILFDSGQIRFVGGIGVMTTVEGAGNAGVSGVDFGDDSSQWANDSECDDPRFEGEGMAGVLLDDDMGRDASDCRALFEAGNISLVPDNGTDGASSSGIDFGDDSSSWANDGECDDPRFKGEGVDTILVDEDLKRDATDCRTLFEAGKITLN